MFRRLISKIPMKISLPLLFTMPVISVVMVLSAIAWVEGHSTANNLMAQNLAQIQDHIKGRLDDLLNVPNRIQRINANLIREGWLSTQNLRSWQLTLLEQVQTFSGISRITWGSADGHSVGIARFSGKAGFEFTIKDNNTDKKLFRYYHDARGQADKTPTSKLEYDPREETWYQDAIKAGKSVWTEPYRWANENSHSDSLALGYAMPLKDSNGRLIGVLNAELTLDDITTFLEKLKVGRTGKAFLVNQKGRLIATSTGVPLTDGSDYPVTASKFTDPQIAAAARHLEKDFGSYGAIDAKQQLHLQINGTSHLLMIAPSKHETGLIWLIATLVPEDDFLATIKAGRQRHFKIGFIAVSVTLVFGVLLAVVSLLPMLDLIAFVRKIDQGDLKQVLKLEYSSEFVQLSKKINTMTAGLRDRMRLRNSLVLAQEVQQNLLPSGIPKIEGLDIAGHAIYCDETGGDYFDYLKIAGLPDTTASIAVGDVVGHGAAAAMLMATARGILRSRCRTPGSLADLLTHLNELLVDDTGGDRFMTMLLMTVDAKHSEVRWATAGHDVPLVYEPATDRFRDFKGSGMTLGLVKGIKYEEYRFTDVQSGQVYMVLTDGLWEAFNQEGEMFGKDRVCDLIRRFADHSAAEISKQIISRFSIFLGGKSPKDDLSFVIVKVL